MPDFFPSRDADVGPFVTPLEALASATAADFGVTAADILPVTTGLTDWNVKYPQRLASQVAADSDKEAKDK